ncbi:SAF domain-containing protein [Actinopolymorpha sp. B11F2]|uniref:SAF domain-containing protein n=1 Tax=Actinopolymorpha sp. B11F2 TaxID=3160862 RepID=UPI0032E4E377
MIDMLTTKRFGRDLRRAVSWHRRLLAAGLAAAGMAVALHLTEPAPVPTATVLAAARDLPGGARLSDSDVRTVALPRDVIPAGALTPGDPRTGRILAGPVRAGAPLTDVDLVGPGLFHDRSEGELVAAPVRVADAGALALVRVGDRIDLLAAETGVEDARSPARYVVREARVLVLPGTGDGRLAAGNGDGSGASGGDLSGDLLSGDSALAGGGGGVGGGFGAEGGLVVVAVPPEVAADLARAAVTARLSLVLRGSPTT